MNKFIKLGKRILALFIVVLLNVNTYAAVGANDGSAFVTKAEFDALVNTFNEQMDTYQSGLNSKIDGAIANYLAGLSSEATNLLDWPNNGQHEFDGINQVDFDPGWPQLSMVGINLISHDYVASGIVGYGGLDGRYNLTSDGVAGKGLIGTSIADEGKVVIIRGSGSLLEYWNTQVEGKDRVYYNTAEALNARTERFQLNFNNFITVNQPANNQYDLVTEETYYDTYDVGHTWAPSCFCAHPSDDLVAFGNQTKVMNYKRLLI